VKKQDIVVGGTYTAKVSGGVVPVRITDERWIGDDHKGWKGVNTQTGRAVTIKSAQRLRRAVEKPGDGTKPADSADVAPGGKGTEVAVAAAGSPVPPKSGKPGGKGAKLASKGGNSPKEPAKKPEAKSKPDRPMSGLDAAAKVLAEAKKPMNCKEIFAEAFKKKYWKSEGATPEATLYAAIIREIAAKGGEARFVKKDRGLFAAAKGA
jgi:hypothetical protein